MTSEVHGPRATRRVRRPARRTVWQGPSRGCHGGTEEAIGSAALTQDPVRPRPRPLTPAGHGESCRGAAAWCAPAPPSPTSRPPPTPLLARPRPSIRLSAHADSRPRTCRLVFALLRPPSPPVSRPPRHPFLGPCDAGRWAGLRALRAACVPGTSDITAASPDPEARASRAPPRSDSRLASQEGPSSTPSGKRVSPRAPCARGTLTSAPCPGWGRPCCPSGAADPPHEAGPRHAASSRASGRPLSACPTHAEASPLAPETGQIVKHVQLKQRKM